MTKTPPPSEPSDAPKKRVRRRPRSSIAAIKAARPHGPPKMSDFGPISVSAMPDKLDDGRVLDPTLLDTPSDRPSRVIDRTQKASDILADAMNASSTHELMRDLESPTDRLMRDFAGPLTITGSIANRAIEEAMKPFAIEKATRPLTITGSIANRAIEEAMKPSAIDQTFESSIAERARDSWLTRLGDWASAKPLVKPLSVQVLDADNPSKITEELFSPNLRHRTGDSIITVREPSAPQGFTDTDLRIQEMAERTRLTEERRAKAEAEVAKKLADQADFLGEIARQTAAKEQQSAEQTRIGKASLFWTRVGGIAALVGIPVALAGTVAAILGGQEVVQQVALFVGWIGERLS